MSLFKKNSCNTENPRNLCPWGICESKNKEVDPDVVNTMIGFSQHIRLDQERMLSIFCCHKDS
ncbi:hypothetical protein IMM1_31530 [Pseudocoprococcus immobilis]